MCKKLPTRHEMVRIAISMEERGFDWREWGIMNRLGDAGRPIRDYILSYAEDVLDMWEGRAPSRGHNASEIVFIAANNVGRELYKELNYPSRNRMDELLAPPTPWAAEEKAAALNTWRERHSKLPRMSPKLGVFHYSQGHCQRKHYPLFVLTLGGKEMLNENDTPRLDVEQIPDSVEFSLAQTLFREISLAFQDPEVQEDYQRWKAERNKSPI